MTGWVAGRVCRDGKVNGGIHNPANLSMYTYALNNPLMYRDPTGLSADALKETAADVAKQAATAGSVKVEASMQDGEHTCEVKSCGFRWNRPRVTR